MISIEIDNKKEFMNRLLGSDSYDAFLLREAVIKVGNTISIDGSENKDFYGSDKDMALVESPYPYTSWDKMRPIIRELIRGKHTPLCMKLVLYLKPDYMEKVVAGADSDISMSAIDYLAINIHYEEGRLSVTTGVAYREFTMDREPEAAWDNYVKKNWNY